MKEFTFICVCYNQENEIIEHLESIKQVVLRFGKGIENDLIVADDASRDNTAEAAKGWIEKNKALFRRAEVLPKQPNMGTVRNMYRAIDSCTTESFKILAGDDKYNCRDIYSLYDGIKNEIVVTPVIPFGNFGDMKQNLINSFKITYRTAIAYNQKHKLGKLLLFRNYLFAPGVFTPGEFWRDSEVRELLSNFVYIEDIPMWMKLIYERKVPVRFEPVAQVCYRVDAGQMLSATRGADIRKGDNETMLRLYPKRLTSGKKYIHPSYYKHLVEKAIYSSSASYDDFFKADPQAAEIYLEKSQVR